MLVQLDEVSNDILNDDEVTLEEGGYNDIDIDESDDEVTETDNGGEEDDVDQEVENNICVDYCF